LITSAITVTRPTAPKPLVVWTTSAVVGPKPSAKVSSDPGDASPHGHTAESFEPVPQVIFASTVVLP